MSGLEFRFQDVLDEIAAVDGVARLFIAPESRTVLRQLKGELETYRDEPTDRPFSWEIRDNLPLNTVVSEGAYEPSGKGSHHVYASITSVWQIKRLRQSKKRKAARPESFALDGKASTRVRIIERQSPEDRELAMWRMEIGDDRAPGCHFHVQVRAENVDPPFPKSLSVPRLPSIIVTPPAVLEYVLGELFQKRWDMHMSEVSGQLNRWASIQKTRLGALLQWHLDTVKESAGSPWQVLKRAKPTNRLFTAREKEKK